MEAFLAVVTVKEGVKSTFLVGCRRQDVHTKSFIVLLASGRWLGVRLDIFSSLLTGAVALAAVLVSEDPGMYPCLLIIVKRLLQRWFKERVQN